MQDVEPGARVSSQVRMVELAVGDPPAVWRAAGFHVADGRVDVGGVRVQLVGTEAGAGILGWAFEPPRPSSIDGLAALAGRSDVHAGCAGGEDPPAHPNAVTALDHVVVASPDVERTTDALADAGIEARRTIRGARGDTGVLYRFFLLGTTLLELIGPADTTDDGPARFAGLAFTTERIDELGLIASPPRDAVQPGRRIATLRREVGSSVPIAFLTPRAGKAGDL